MSSEKYKNPGTGGHLPDILDRNFGIFAHRKMDSLYTYPVNDAVTDANSVQTKQNQVQGSVSSKALQNRFKREKAVPDGIRELQPLTISTLSTRTTDTQLVLPVHEKNALQTDWLVIVLFAGIFVFATIRYSYVKYIRHLFTSMVNYTTSLRLLQENNYPAGHAAYRLDVVFYLSFSIFVFQLFNFYGLEHARKGITYFAMVLGGVLIYFYGKRSLYLFVGSLFRTDPETSEFLFNMDNFRRSLGIVLLPLVALISFSPASNPVYIVFAALSTTIVFYIINLQRGVQILFRKQFSILYLFLYLCTLEFLPLLLIYKIVVVE